MLWMRRLQFLFLAWSTAVFPAQGILVRNQQNGLPPSVAKTLKELDSVNDLMFKITLKACVHYVDTNRLNAFRDFLTQIIHTAELGKYHNKKGLPSHHFPQIEKTLKWCHERAHITTSKPKKHPFHKHSLGKAAPLNLRFRQKLYSTINYMMTIILTSCSPEVHQDFKKKGIKLPPSFKQEFIFLLSKNMDAFDSAFKKSSIQETMVEELFEEIHTCSKNI